MLDNYSSFILDSEEDARSRYGRDVVLKKRKNITKTTEKKSDFYNSPSDPNENFYSFSTEEITIRAIINWETEEGVDKTQIGQAKVGDARLEKISLDYEDDLKQAIRHPEHADIGKEDIIVDGEAFIPIEVKKNVLNTHLTVLIERKISE